MSNIRDAVTLFARTLEGLSADPADELTRRVYLDTIAPGETPQRADEMGENYNCELLALAVLRHVIAHRLLLPPYPSGKAGEILVAIAREAHALRPLHVLPEPGDIVLVSPPEHAWICLTVAASPYDAGVTLCDGLDGVPVDGHRAIVVRAHELRQGRDNAGGDRSVVAVLDVAKIVECFGR